MADAAPSPAKSEAQAAFSDAGNEVKEAAGEAAERGAKVAEQARQGASALEDTIVREASELAASVADRLKSVGVDTDVMVNAAKDHATELQRLIAEELQARPYRALGIAAGIGLLVGFLSAR